MRCTRVIYCLIGMMLAVFASAASASPAPSVIKVGTLYASGGNLASISTPVYKGMKLWVKQVNDDGGAYVKAYDKKIPIKLIAYDDQSSTSTAATLYNRLITSDHVNMLVADSGSVLTSVAVPIAREHKMLLFDQTGTGTKFFTKDNPYIALLNIPASDAWPAPLINFLTRSAAQHGIHKLALLFDTNDFTSSQAKVLKDALKKADNVDIVYYHGVPTDTDSYLVLLHRIQAANPDALIALGYPDNDIALLRDLASSGISFPLVFTVYTGLETELMVKNLGEDGIMGTVTYVPANKLSAFDINFGYGMKLPEFKKTYTEAYGSGDFGFNSVAGYNTGLILQKVLATSASLDQMAMRKALFAQSGKLKTLTGTFKLDKDGAQVGEILPIGQFQKKDGKMALVPVYPKQVAQREMQWSAAQ